MWTVDKHETLRTVYYSWVCPRKLFLWGRLDVQDAAWWPVLSQRCQPKKSIQKTVENLGDCIAKTAYHVGTACIPCAQDKPTGVEYSIDISQWRSIWMQWKCAPMTMRIILCWSTVVFILRFSISPNLGSTLLVGHWLFQVHVYAKNSVA